MMLVSVSAQASAKGLNRGLNEVSHSARVALQARLIADSLLPAQTEAGLTQGIRFEMPLRPACHRAASRRLGTPVHFNAEPIRILREALLNLPPPSA